MAVARSIVEFKSALDSKMKRSIRIGWPQLSALSAFGIILGHASIRRQSGILKHSVLQGGGGAGLQTNHVSSHDVVAHAVCPVSLIASKNNDPQ